MIKLSDKNQIIIGLNGGLGNQLYQYAFGRALSEKLNCDLVLDTSFYHSSSNIFKETFRLGNFSLNKKVKITKELNSSFFFLLRVLRKIFTKNPVSSILFNFFFNNKVKNIFLEKSFLFQEEIISKAKTNSYFFGYWQSIRYFEKINNILINELDQINLDKTLINRFINENINQDTAILHIRGGDMAEDGLMDYVPVEFYIKSINYLKLLHKNLKIHVITDDIDYAKLVMKKVLTKNETCFFIHELGLTDLGEFYLMRNYKNYIIARSTFSWWASYLSYHEDKKVIMSSTWFKKQKTPNDRIAKNMMVL